MRFQRDSDVPHGAPAIVIVKRPGHAAAVRLNGKALPKDLADRLYQRFLADPDILKGLGWDGV